MFLKEPRKLTGNRSFFAK